MPLTLTGCVYRISGSLLLMLWLLRALSPAPWGSAFKRPVFLSLIALTLHHAFTVALASTPSLSLDFIEGRFWSLLLIFVFADLQQEENFWPQLKRNWIALITIVISYGIYQVLIGFPHLRDLVSNQLGGLSKLTTDHLLTRIHSNAMFSTFLYPNLFAVFCSLALLSMPVYLKRRSSKTSTFFVPLMTIALLYALFTTDSKGAWVSLTAALALILAIQHFKKNFRWVLGITVFSLGTMFLTRHFWIEVFRDSAFIRMGYYEGALSIFKSHIWGVGIQNFSELYPRHMLSYGTVAKMAHNDHLQVLAEGGLIGISLYIFFYLSLCSTLWLRKNIDHDNAHLEPKKNFFPAFSICIFLLVSCLILRQGPMDLFKHGWTYLILLFLLLWFGTKLHFHHSLFSWKTLPFLWLIYFFMHSSLDFPYYDHSLFTIFIILTLGWSKPPPVTKQHSWLFKVFIAFVLTTLCFLANTRFSNLFHFECIQLHRSDPEAIKSLCLKMPRELYPWQKAYRAFSQVSDPDFISDDLLLFFCDGVLKCNPESSFFHLEKARLLKSKPEAEKHYRKAIETFPRLPRPHLYYALYLQEAQKTDAAIREFQLARTLHRQAEKQSRLTPGFKTFLLEDIEFQKIPPVQSKK